MAKKDKNKKKKKDQKWTKKPVSMVLKQDHRIGEMLTRQEQDHIYHMFRARCETKSAHAYVDLGETPKLLRLYLLGTKFNSTVEFLVKFGSFTPIMGSSEGTEDTEIGFTVELKSPLIKGTMKLEVLRRQFKATLHIPA